MIFLNKFKENTILRNIVTLFSGTMIAQAIPVMLSPLITRFYTPTEFGSFTLFISISTVVGSIAAAKYEMAIVLPDKRQEAYLLSWVSVLIVMLTTVLTVLALFLLPYKFTAQLGDSIYLMPLSIASLGLINILTYWHGRRKKYMLLSQSKVAQSISNGAAQVGFGLTYRYFNGLILAQIIGQVVFIIVSSRQFFIRLWRFKNHLSISSVSDILKKYKGFILFYTPTALLDNVSMQAPVFILSSFFGIASAGIFGLTYRIVSLPLTLISSAIGQVYYQKIAELKNQGAPLTPHVATTAKKLLLLSILPTIVLVIFGELLFTVVFGNNWASSGYYAQILAIPFAIRFIASPLSSVLVVNNKLKVLSAWQVLYFTSTVSILYIGSSKSLSTFIYMYGINELVLYILYLFLIIKYSKN